ncbi:MAG: CxxxxCH/CxxCH domain-containing protein [Myxococcota bacterium]
MRAHLASVLLLGVVASGCLILRDEDKQAKDRRCTACHGNASAEGDSVLKSAPPNDTRGNSGVESPGVGAHQTHLRASSTHAAIACAQCHLVPERTESPGHNDTDGPAELTFGFLASLDAGSPRYDATARSCSDVYCHGYAASQPWNQPRSSDDACGSCHGVPPAAPHPQNAACHACHGTVIKPDRSFIDPARHVDGTVQVGELACNSCHGSTDAGNPPPSLDGGTSRDQLGVGAHVEHLAGFANSRTVQCTECHVVPQRVDSPGHANGVVDVIFSGVALGPLDGGAAWDRSAATCTAWCHTAGATAAVSPPWTSTSGPLGCNGCHALPPPAPHPGWSKCSACHPNATGDAGSPFVDKTLHVDGVVNAALPANCDGCHGSTANAAPPRDLSGNSDTTLRSVGAHQSHLRDAGIFRVVECGDCHPVPAQTIAPGHANGTVELVFSGPAIAGGSMPTFDGTSCSNTTCHKPDALRSGGTSTGGTDQTPVWTRVDGSQVNCFACHAFPPPAPHPQNFTCETCHLNYGGGGVFRRPDLHVNGNITFNVP